MALQIKCHELVPHPTLIDIHLLGWGCCGESSLPALLVLCSGLGWNSPAPTPSHLWCCLQEGSGEGELQAREDRRWGQGEAWCGACNPSTLPPGQAGQTQAGSSLSSSFLPADSTGGRAGLCCISPAQTWSCWQIDPRKHKLPKAVHFGVPTSDPSLNED